MKKFYEIFHSFHSACNRPNVDSASHALEMLTNRPAGMSESAAKRLILNPNTTDTVFRNIELISTFSILPFTGERYIRRSYVLVHYDGRAWKS